MLKAKSLKNLSIILSLAFSIEYKSSTTFHITREKNYRKFCYKEEAKVIFQFSNGMKAFYLTQTRNGLFTIWELNMTKHKIRN